MLLPCVHRVLHGEYKTAPRRVLPACIIADPATCITAFVMQCAFVEVQAAATSAAATAADAAPLPAETDDMSPAQTHKRRRDATSVAGPSKRLRFVVSTTSVTIVRTHADATESTARLNILPASAKRT